MKRLATLLIGLSTLFACTSDDAIDFYDLVENVDFIIRNDTLLANGSDNIRGFIVFKENSDLSKISAKISVNNLTIEDAEETEMSITPEQLPDNTLVYQFVLLTTTAPGRASLEVNVNGFSERFPFTAGFSQPASISLSANASSSPTNFLGSVSLEANLKSDSNRKVSRGVKVVFRDILSDGSPANGAFRSESLTTAEESKASAIYSPGLIDGDQFITLIVEVVDDDGNTVGISDSIELYVYSL